MKAEFKIETLKIRNLDDCILVDNEFNYALQKFTIFNLPYIKNGVHLLKDKNSVGVWKIKQLNK